MSRIIQLASCNIFIPKETFIPAYAAVSECLAIAVSPLTDFKVNKGSMIKFLIVTSFFPTRGTRPCLLV